jgi:hypothetical protein
MAGSWTTLAYPGISGDTLVVGISGSSIVGTYYDDCYDYFSFLYIIPEPATMLLLALGGLAIRRRHR